MVSTWEWAHSHLPARLTDLRDFCGMLAVQVIAAAVCQPVAPSYGREINRGLSSRFGIEVVTHSNSINCQKSSRQDALSDISWHTSFQLPLTSLFPRGRAFSRLLLFRDSLFASK